MTPKHLLSNNVFANVKDKAVMTETVEKCNKAVCKDAAFKCSLCSRRLPWLANYSRGLCLNCDVMTTYVDKAFANYNPPEDRGTADSEETDESQQSDSDGSDRSYDSEDDPETERLRDELQRLCSSGAGPSDAFNDKLQSIKSRLREIRMNRSRKSEDTNIGPSEFYYRYGDPIYDYDSEAQDRGSDSDSD